ncbi:hypothetical protein B0T14DRAFT_423816 [Immersiella caudata]|uniref:Uncharacterized protein n=1 Tax=Immersiella caudata TaxID=314043 RepID=A0AA39X5I1_9PEZI|nr:hypothetical protein B0T14DRAFT_423816 [Immersiella caudata]
MDFTPIDLKARPLPAHLAEHEDDENGWQSGYIKGTDFSLPYNSPWSRRYGNEVAQDLFRGLNCGYFSTPGVAPTLLALKMHAQALCRLIQAIDPTEDPKKIANTDDATNHIAAEADVLPRYDPSEAFDFLDDLDVPYYNDDPSHHKPLTMLLNEVRSRHEAYGATTYHCPFHKAGKPREHGAPAKPYATHQSLIMHANDCLERLDHEFSSSGGILSLLPTNAEHGAADLSAARNSLLGQWLLHTQTLTARLHELERAHGNACLALAGEAHIPHQVLSELGPDGRSGRTTCFPQDKYILVNAGEDAFEHIHLILDKLEATEQERHKVYKELGAVGEAIWQQQRNGVDYARGIVPVTIPTRYYRIMGQGHHTLFVLPAYDNHPGVKYFKELEEKPTIVATPMPTFPARVSEWEKKYDGRVEKAKELELENAQLKAEVVRGQEGLRQLRAEMELLAKRAEGAAHAQVEAQTGKGSRGVSTGRK